MAGLVLDAQDAAPAVAAPTDCNALRKIFGFLNPLCRAIVFIGAMPGGAIGRTFNRIMNASCNGVEACRNTP